MRLTPEQSRAVDYCTYCPRLCHAVCPSAHGDASEASTAWGLMSLVHAVRDGQLTLDASVAARWYRCASCDRCQRFCKHGNDVAGTMRAARASLFETGQAPANIVALAERFRAEGAAQDIEPSVAPKRREARVGLLLACETRAVWGAERCETLRALLERWFGEPVADVTDAVRCCGSAAERIGDVGTAERARHEARHALTGLREIVSDCEGASSLAAAGSDVVVTPLLQALAQRVPRELEARASAGAPEPLTVHGACGDRRRWDTRRHEERLLQALGAATEPAWAMEGEQECCGGELTYRSASPKGARRAAEALCAGARANEGTRLVSSRVGCAAHLSASAEVDVPSVLDWVLERVETLR